MISYPWMDKKKNLFIVPGISLMVGFIAAMWIIWQPLWELKTSGLSFTADRIISHRLPNLKKVIRKILLLPSEEDYQKLYQDINKKIYNKIDKQKDSSDDIASQNAADVIFPVTKRISYLKTPETVNLTDDENKLIWKFVSDQNKTQLIDLISIEFKAVRNNVLGMTLNPLGYIDYFLQQRYLSLTFNENLQMLEKHVKDSKVSITIVTHPKQQNFDSKIIRLEIENLGFASLVLDEIDLLLEASPGTKANLIFERDDSLTPSGKILSSGIAEKDNEPLKFSGVNLQISGRNSPSGFKTALFVVSDQPIKFKSAELKLTNFITKKQVKESKSNLINDETFRFLESISQSPTEFVRQNKKFILQNKGDNKDSITLLPPGKYFFQDTIVIPETFSEVRFLPGTTIKFAPGVSLISYSPIIAEGTINSPIKFMPASSSPWGTLAVVNTKLKRSLVRYISIEGAGPTIANGIIFSGGLAAHYADIDIFDSVFTRNHGDDGVNIKYSTTNLRKNLFIGNDYDGLDLDSVSGIIKDNIFSNNGGDGLDISWNTTGISDNFMSNNKDKCLSIGEKSSGEITGNTFENCDIGVAIKDSSDISLINNIIRHNRQGLAVYQKKTIFGGGIAKLNNNIFSGNQTDIWTDEQSTATDENR